MRILTTASAFVLAAGLAGAAYAADPPAGDSSMPAATNGDNGAAANTGAAPKPHHAKHRVHHRHHKPAATNASGTANGSGTGDNTPATNGDNMQTPTPAQ